MVHRCGFVALCGRPNVGKSTLLNALIGEPLAVATPHPQTTRERLRGVWTTDSFQAALVDTPGIHRARSALNKFMVGQAVRAAKDVDLVLLLADVPRLVGTEAAEAWRPGEVAAEALKTLADIGRPIVLVLTKVDLLADPALLLPVLRTWSTLHDFAAVVPTSATQGEGLEALRDEIEKHLPEGPALFDTEQLSDRSMRWHAAELVRAELFASLGQELPYSCAVMVTRYREGEQDDVVDAVIYVERPSQKGMVIGKNGAMIARIRKGGQARIAALTGRKCRLALRVDVAKNWTRDPDALSKVGYAEPEDR